MLRNIAVLWSVVTVLASIVSLSLCISSPRTREAMELTMHTTVAFRNMFLHCFQSPMPAMKFELDDLKNFVNKQSRTTVGYAPRFTTNRKFFANLLSSPEFKAILAEDEKLLWKNSLEKMRYCDTVVMDQNLLQLMYDREVDQSKM